MNSVPPSWSSVTKPGHESVATGKRGDREAAAMTTRTPRTQREVRPVERREREQRSMKRLGEQQRSASRASKTGTGSARTRVDQGTEGLHAARP